MNLDFIKKTVLHKIERNENIIKDFKDDRDKLSKHGEWSLGYREGYVSAMECVLGMIEDIEKDN